MGCGFKLYVNGHRKLRGGEGSCRVEGDQFYRINADTVCLDLSGKLCLWSVEKQENIFTIGEYGMYQIVFHSEGELWSQTLQEC